MGKKNRNKRHDCKSAKLTAKPSNGKTQRINETINKKEPQILIEIDASTPESMHKIATCTTINNLAIASCNMDKLFDTVIGRIDLGAKMAMETVKTFVEVEGGCFNDDVKKATIKMINEKLNKRLHEIQGKLSSDSRTTFSRIHVDDNGLEWLLDVNIENIPIESNSHENGSTSTPATALTSESGLTADESQKVQRLESVSETLTNNSDPLPVDSDFGEQSDCMSEEGNNVTHLNESNDTVHDDYARMFHCLHCQLKLGNQNRFETFKQAYNHWEREHNNHLQTLPFHFYTTEYGNCAYCDHVGSYWDLLKHQSTKHPSFPLAITDIINCRKCALCSYIGTDVPGHSQVHRIYKKNFSSRHIARMTNPLSYTDETYDERLLLRIHQKHRCLECGLAFDTAFLQRQHFLFKHPQSAQSLLKCNAKIFFDNSRHMICGCCSAQIPWNGFLEHISTVTFEFPCDKCSFTFIDLVDLICHDRTDHNINNSTFMRTLQLSNRLKKYYQSTRIVHGNGFVITRQNILSTKYDEWPEFSDYIDGLIETIKRRLKEMKFFEMDCEEPMKWNKRNQMICQNEKEQETNPLGLQGSGNTNHSYYDKMKKEDDVGKGEINEINITIPKPSKAIAYKRLSKRTGARILCEKVIEKKSNQPIPKKKAKSNKKKINTTNETDYNQ